jgi:hypothetical protein
VLAVAGKEKGEETTERRSSAWSYRASTTSLMEGRGRGGESGHGLSPRRRAGSACLGAWQPLGSGSPTWHGEGRTAEMTWAVERATRQRAGEGSRAAGARGRPAVEDTRAWQRNKGARGLEEEDRGPSCKKQKTQGPYCKA